MKKVLIISPFFPPVNAADMHRVRQSISYYKENNWDVEVVIVDPIYVNMYKDNYLLETIPSGIKIHKVKALNENLTRKIGMGSIAYRSLYYYWKQVNYVLKNSKFDLIFFSTTAFPVTILGRFWKAKFAIPYIIDMQDPWRSDHYLDLPKAQRPSKFWLSYTLDAILEKFSMKKVDGIMSVSQKYIDTLSTRYPRIKNIPTSVIPFAALDKDIDVAKNTSIQNPFFSLSDSDINIVYIGRGGNDMVLANTLFLKAIKAGIDKVEEFKKIKVFYIGTSYDASTKAEKTIMPIAKQLGIEDRVIEITQRIPYFQSLKVLSEADILFVPGSDNIGYTASKIYAYAWLEKPLLTLFHSSSSVNTFMEECNIGLALQFDLETESALIEKIIAYIKLSINTEKTNNVNWTAFEKYTASYQVKKQIELFNSVLENHGN